MSGYRRSNVGSAKYFFVVNAYFRQPVGRKSAALSAAWIDSICDIFYQLLWRTKFVLIEGQCNDTFGIEDGTCSDVRHTAEGAALFRPTVSEPVRLSFVFLEPPIFN